MIESNFTRSTTLQITNSNNQNKKQKIYDLEKRTLNYSKDVFIFVKNIQKNIINNEILKQVIRSSSSIGANYIEANESLGKKDFIMRIKICRKESKETVYWLKLLDLNEIDFKNKCESLIEEAIQFIKIFSAIIEKSK